MQQSRHAAIERAGTVVTGDLLHAAAFERALQSVCIAGQSSAGKSFTVSTLAGDKDFGGAGFIADASAFPLINRTAD